MLKVKKGGRRRYYSSKVRSSSRALLEAVKRYPTLKARILKWLAIPFSSGPHSVRPLHHDLPVLGGPTRHGSVSLS